MPPAVAFFAQAIEAAALKDGHVTEAVHEVRVAEGGSPPTPANVHTAVGEASIETGTASRAEITFRDRSAVRLGDNTQLTIGSRSRTFELTSGAILTQVPPGVGGTLLKVRNITATATGATLIVECLPEAYTKFISLDGTCRLCLKTRGWGNDCVLLRPGQMLIASPEPKRLPEPADVDLTRLLETSQFITEFSALPAQDRVARAAVAQSKKKSHGNFADTNLVIFGRGTVVSQKGSEDSKAKQQDGGIPTPSAAAERSPTAAVGRSPTPTVSPTK
jgi:hypothetical protein